MPCYIQPPGFFSCLGALTSSLRNPGEWDCLHDYRDQANEIHGFGTIVDRTRLVCFTDWFKLRPRWLPSTSHAVST